jgi:Arc/MetJ family transcription regulator
MKTTIDIPDALLEGAMQYTKAGTKLEAVLIALEELNKRYRMAALVRYSNACDFDTNDEIEQREQDEAVNE